MPSPHSNLLGNRSFLEWHRSWWVSYVPTCNKVGFTFRSILSSKIWWHLICLYPTGGGSSLGTNLNDTLTLDISFEMASLHALSPLCLSNWSACFILLGTSIPNLRLFLCLRACTFESRRLLLRKVYWTHDKNAGSLLIFSPSEGLWRY